MKNMWWYVTIACVSVLFFLPDVDADLVLSESQLSFGSSSQEKINASAHNVVLSKTLSLQASANYTDVQVEWSFGSGIDSSDVEVLNVPSVMNNSASVTLEVKMTIPSDVDAVNDDLEGAEIDAGSFVVKG